MKKRVLYPGSIEVGSRILITGSINTMYLCQAACSLALGIQAKGYSCKILIPGMPRPYADYDQAGDPESFKYDTEVALVVAGEYLGDQSFRQGSLDLPTYARCVFFSPLADPNIAYTRRLPWESERIVQAEEYLNEQLGVATKLAPACFLRPSGTEQALLELSSELLYYLERGFPVPDALHNKRERLYSADGLDQLPALERPLW